MLVKGFGCTIYEVTLTFTIAIFTLGSQRLLIDRGARKGPRVVGANSGVFYGLGVFPASFRIGAFGSWLRSLLRFQVITCHFVEDLFLTTRFIARSASLPSSVREPS